MCVAGVYEGFECHITHVGMTIQLWELSLSFHSIGPETELKSSDLVVSTFAHQANLLFQQIDIFLSREGIVHKRLTH